MSFFDFKRVAEGYLNHRTYFHPVIINKIKKYFNIDTKLNHSLDAGCGAGLSAKALFDISEKVTGIDNSQEMINYAEKNINEIEFICSPAETLHFDDNTFDLITVGGAINWIDRTKFLKEVNRTLKPNGALVIYDNFYTDRLKNNAAYKLWFNDQYLKIFPKPYRNEDPFTKEEASQYNIEYLGEELYTNTVTMSLDQIINYILTQSNVINTIELNNRNINTVKKWFYDSLSEIIKDDNNEFEFEGFIWYFKNNTNSFF